MGVSRGPDTTVLDFLFFALGTATTSDTSSIIMTIAFMRFMVGYTPQVKFGDVTIIGLRSEKQRFRGLTV